MGFECKRRSPTIIEGIIKKPKIFEPKSMINVFRAVWPHTMEGMWCGEFQKKTGK